MRRKLFLIASVLSMLLSIASAVLWVIDLQSTKIRWFAHDRQWWQIPPHRMEWRWADARFELGFDDDGMFLSRENVVTEAQIDSALSRWNSDVIKSAPRWVLSRAEVAVGIEDETPYMPDRIVYASRGSLRLFPRRGNEFSTAISPPLASWRRLTVSMLLPTIAFLILPAIWALVFVRRWWRRRDGVCEKCSYNLTGNTSCVCPECGTAVTGKNANV
jgi:hypothetical protein